MSKEAALQFLNTLGTNEKAKELFKDREKPTSEEEKIKAYTEIAAGLGEQITAEDFREAVQYIAGTGSEASRSRRVRHPGPGRR